MTKKDTFAPTPPMGWNSWDCYGASVTEEELLGNAQYMAKHLKPYGWEYVVCDIQWYEPTADSTEYHDFVPLEMDAYSRLIPAVNRFPSAANGAGFSVIAEKIHRLGLKFGIHIMRGIPRQAVHADTPIWGTDVTARQIAQRFSVCSWNTDMYGVNPAVRGAQEYYDSLFSLYASWGVDFVKVDDICNTFYKPADPYSARGEIELIRNAIDKCGRNIVLSLSPGPADVTYADHLQRNANMWRLTGDFWDRWPDLYAMFERCHVWSPYVKTGCWPDCDMLPIGHINLRGAEHGDLVPRYTRFTHDEQRTLMTLWCVFRSPLMIGGELRDSDEFTLSLLTNADVLRVLNHSCGAHQVMRTGNAHEYIVWQSLDEDGSVYVALFNTHNKAAELQIALRSLDLQGEFSVYDLWERKRLANSDSAVGGMVAPHGVLFVRLTPKGE